MQHASDTNRKDKAQKAARREKFNGNHSDKTMLNENNSTNLDFSHLSPEEIAEERKRIQEVFAKQRKKYFLVFILALIIVVLGAIWSYNSFLG